MFHMKCKSDKDCPPYSTCESVASDNGENYSVCKFEDFLCPERTDGFFLGLKIMLKIMSKTLVYM